MITGKDQTDAACKQRNRACAIPAQVLCNSPTWDQTEPFLLNCYTPKGFGMQEMQVRNKLLRSWRMSDDDTERYNKCRTKKPAPFLLRCCITVMHGTRQHKRAWAIPPRHCAKVVHGTGEFGMDGCSLPMSCRAHSEALAQGSHDPQNLRKQIMPQACWTWRWMHPGHHQCSVLQ